MLSSVLNSERAVQVNIEIMRTFVHLRQAILYNDELRRELQDLKQISEERFHVVFETLDQLLKMDEKSANKIGFEIKEDGAPYGNKKMS